MAKSSNQDISIFGRFWDYVYSIKPNKRVVLYTGGVCALSNVVLIGVIAFLTSVQWGVPFSFAFFAQGALLGGFIGFLTGAVLGLLLGDFLPKGLTRSSVEAIVEEKLAHANK